MLRQRGETPVEIAGMVRAMLKQRFPVNVRTYVCCFRICFRMG